MPQDREAYRMGREAINKEAEHRYSAGFLALPYREQDIVLKAIHDGAAEGRGRYLAEDVGASLLAIDHGRCYRCVLRPPLGLG